MNFSRKSETKNSFRRWWVQTILEMYLTDLKAVKKIIINHNEFYRVCKEINGIGEIIKIDSHTKCRLNLINLELFQEDTSEFS